MCMYEVEPVLRQVSHIWIVDGVPKTGADRKPECTQRIRPTPALLAFLLRTTPLAVSNPSFAALSYNSLDKCIRVVEKAHLPRAQKKQATFKDNCVKKVVMPPIHIVSTRPVKTFSDRFSSKCSVETPWATYARAGSGSSPKYTTRRRDIQSQRPIVLFKALSRIHTCCIYCMDVFRTGNSLQRSSKQLKPTEPCQTRRSTGP